MSGMYTLPARLVTCIVCCAVTSAAGAAPLSADGDFTDWQPAHLLATDAVGDNTGAFDITSVWAQSRGTELWLRFDIGQTLNLQSGMQSDGALRLELMLPDNGSLTIDFRDRSAWRNGNPTDEVDWIEIDFHTGPTYASPEHEVHLDLAELGVEPGDTVEIDFSGADALAQPVALTLDAPIVPEVRRTLARGPGSAFRIASINTLSNGLTHNARGPQLARLIDAVEADIYCFQEEYNNSAQTIAGVLQTIDPFDDQSFWNVIKTNDNVIASRSTVIKAPTLNDDYAAAVVDLPSTPVFVLSIHPKCCGYAGNSDDQSRIDATTDMVRTIGFLRDLTLGSEFIPFADAPVIVVGDWNLVGSRTPLDLMEDPAGPALTRLRLPRLIGDEVTTWRSGPGSSFWPGQLDLLTWSDQSLGARKAFLFDTEQLNAAETTAYGVSRTDSQASDHFMLVADFGIVPDCPGDANGDLTIDFFDINLVIGNFAGNGPAGDVNLDGVVNVLDLNVVVGNFGVSCP